MGRELEHITDLLIMALNVVALIAFVRAKQVNQYRALTGLVCLRLITDVISIAVLHLIGGHLVNASFAYKTYFYFYWASFAGDSLLSLSVIFAIFRLAMAPLKGLERLGSLVFRWASAISIALAVLIGVSGQPGRGSAIIFVVNQLQRISNVLILCLLLFVCFAIKPMGLSYRSRTFGVSLGLGISASANLVCTAWLVNNRGLSSLSNLVWNFAEFTTLAIWITYFALPEPKARIIVLPTTSPYLRWNQISEALGDEPGFVAVAGVPPEVFSPAEVEIMFRASAKMRPLFDEPFVSGAGPEPSITSLTA